MSSAQELVVIVNEENAVIDQVERRVMREQRLIHRASYVLVFNGKGELFVQQRTRTKDIYPGYYDIAAGGVVLAEESYEVSARRELFEELGVVSNGLEYHFDHYFAAPENRVWGRVFSCQHEGPFVLQPEEVENGQFLPVAEILDRARRVPFTPDGLALLKRYLSIFRIEKYCQ